MVDERIVVTIDPDLQELIPQYLEKMKQNCHEILASPQRDCKLAAVYGHQMKGSGGGYGFEAITTYGAELEEAAKSNDYEQVIKIAQELSHYLDHVEVTYS